MRLRSRSRFIFSSSLQRSFHRVLLASHGTAAAHAAERAALELCLAGGTLVHLHVVPGLWRGMMGDDWLNNAATRDTYGRHIETELAREIEALRKRLADAARTHDLLYEHEIAIGDPAECLVAHAAKVKPGLVVIGARRPRGASGLRSRMDLDLLARTLDAPFLVVPGRE